MKDSKGDIALLFVRKLRQDYLSVIEKQKGLEKKGDKVNVVEPPLLSKLLLVVRLFTKQVYESIKLAIVKKVGSARREQGEKKEEKELGFRARIYAPGFRSKSLTGSQQSINLT